MTREETIKILAILKAAYPNSYKNMTKDEANGTVMVWATQFADAPADIVMIAINKLISTNTFPPSISEVKSKIKNLYWEAWCRLDEHKKMPFLDDTTVKQLERIIDYTEPMRARGDCETSLTSLLNGYTQKYLGGGTV